MPHYFDDYGILSADPIPGRSTDVAPPDTPLPQGFVWRWEGYDWAPFDPAPPAAQPAPTQNRHITQLAFRRRFTKAERSAVEWAAVDKPDRPDPERQMAAALRADLKDQEQAGFIDLDDPDLIEGVTAMEGYGLIAAGRAAEILSAPVQGGERP